MTKNVDLSDLINLKCIDDFNNKLGIILENNINGLLKILDIKYKIDIPQSNMFSNQVENNTIYDDIDDNIDNIDNIIAEKKYSKDMLFDPYK
tara:strand:+ start:1091 stop:1366 length:276 start_codon:yes stop_codon:yes gene_type:complete